MFAGAAVVIVVVAVVVGGAQVVELDAGLGAETHGRAGAARVAVRVLEPGAVGVGVVSAAATTTTAAAVVVVGGATEEYGGLHHLQRQPDDIGRLGACGLGVSVGHHTIVGREILVLVAVAVEVVDVAHDGDFAGLAAAVLALLAPLPRNAGALEREDGEAIGAVGVVASLVVGRGGSIQQLLGRVGEARGQGRASAGGRVRGAAGRGRRRRGRGRGRGRGRLRQMVERVEQPRRGGAELGVGGGRWTGGA